MNTIRIKTTDHSDLFNVQALWADPTVMHFVGFPEGLHETMEHLETEWLPWVQSPPVRQHYSVYAEGVGYCGETFYDVDETGLACMDIKLIPAARGKGIASYALSHALDQAFLIGGAKRAYVDPAPENTAARKLYERLGFRQTDRAAHLEDPGCPYVYLEVSRESWQAWRGIRYQDIILRTMRESDIADEVRWNTTETQWSLWDAPWEMEEAVRNFDPEAETKRLLEFINSPKPPIPYSLELDTAEGIHIGTVSNYLIDENFDWISRKDAEGKQVYYTLGIDIAESSFWGKGYGTRALTAWTQYFLTHGITQICLQTWSGNIRMITCAEKLGFSVCHREIGNRQVRGGIYDGLTFRLDLDKFHTYLAENP